MENRECPRFRFEHPLKFARFNSDNFSYRLANSWNCSQGGIGFESRTGVKPGTAIYFRLENSTLPSEIPDALRMVGVATVRWCEEFSGVYRIGVKYVTDYH